MRPSPVPPAPPKAMPPWVRCAPCGDSPARPHMTTLGQSSPPIVDAAALTGATADKQFGVYHLACALTCLLFFPLAATAQSVESVLPPGSEALALDASHFVVPDIPDVGLKALNIVDPHDSYAIKFGAAVLPADFTSFTQNAASTEQVGVQDDKYEVRSMRLNAYGYFEFMRRWNYLFSYEYKGFDRTPSEANWAPSDIRLTTAFEHVGTLSFGKIKEPFVYEMVGDSPNLPQSERLMSPFFKSRNVGMMLTNTMLNQRATWAIGAYDNWLTTSSQLRDAGKDVAARLTALPVWEDDGANYLHLGVSVRYVGADSDVLRFTGKPASNVASNYVDTGKMIGNHAWNTGLEAMWDVGPYSILAEYDTSSVSSAASGDPHFSGYYVTASWVLTGEHRPYDRKAAYARRVQPQGRWGAWEVMARYGRVDLDNAQVHGGTMRGWWTAVNWWATRRWKFSISAGDVDLDRFGITGNTKEILSRVQWIY